MVWESWGAMLCSPFSLAGVTNPHSPHSEGAHCPPQEVRPQAACSLSGNAEQLSGVYRSPCQGHDHDISPFHSGSLVPLKFLQMKNSLLMCCCHWAELRADQLQELRYLRCRTCLEEGATLGCLI